MDSNQEGLLERYLRNFGMELDESIVPFINNFLDLFDAVKCQKNLLPHLAFILGLPITIDDTEATYRKVLKYAIQLYKIKGTAQSYGMLFNLIGLEVSVIEDTPGISVIYDASPVFIYDDPTGVRLYDTGCANCSGYSIAYSSIAQPLNPDSVTPDLLVIAQKIICFLQPINAKLDGFIKTLKIVEPFVIGITEETTLDQFVEIPGDFSDDFDTDEEFN